MIQLKSDYLVFQTTGGEQIPCSAEWVSLELMGDGANFVDHEMVRNASVAVLHYFKHELHRQTVSVGEFALALEKVLRGFGLSIYADTPPQPPPPQRVAESNLTELAGSAASQSFELHFFPQLRQEVKRQLDLAPTLLRFHGLRPCVKQLTGASRWNRRCDHLNDQIVDYLRTCWETEATRGSCALVVV